MSANSPVGVIAGGGDLPRLLTEYLNSIGREVAVLAFDTDSEWLKNANAIKVNFEKPGQIFAELKRRGVSQVCLAGHVQRPRLDFKKFDLTMWKLAVKLLPALKAGDDYTLRYILYLFEKKGFEVVSAQSLCQELFASRSMKINTKLSPQDHRDIARGVDILRSISDADIGQGCVVANGLCLGVETIQGTEAMLNFVSQTKTSKGGVFVKLPKAGQDTRVDMPTIGVDTIEQVKAAGLNGLALVENGALVLDRSAVEKAANDAQVFIQILNADQL